MSDEEILAKLQGDRQAVNAAASYLADRTDWRRTVSIMLQKNRMHTSDFDSILFESLCVLCSLVKQNKFKKESSLKTFFQGICKNVIRNKKALEARYAKRVILMEPVHIQSKEPYNHAEHLSHERAQSLKELFRGVLDRMGNPCKKSLIMKMQGFKDVEIADKLEFSHGGIRKRLSKCRQALRELVLQDESLMNEIDFLK